MLPGGVQGPTFGLSQQADEAGGSLTSEVRGRAASSLDNAETGWDCQTARVRQARREGVTRVNRWSNPLKHGTVLKPGGYGPGSSARQPDLQRLSTPPAILDVAGGGHGEGLRRSRGEAAGEKPGTAPVDRDMVNMGTVCDRPFVGQPGRWRAGPPSTDGRRRGGVRVVVGASESGAQGEGGQQACSCGIGMPGGRR